MSSRGQNTLFVGLVAAVLLSLIAFGAAQAFSFNGTVSGPSPVHKNADGIVEYSVIHAAHASDDWDDPVVVERRVVAEKPADTVYKAKTEVVSDKSITKKAKIFRGKEKRGIFGRIFGGKKQQANDAAFNHELASVGQKSSTQQDEFGIPSDALGSAPALVSDSTVDGSAATGIYTSEIDWKANEYKIPSANKKATKKNARKDAFALSTQEKRDLGLESGVHYENDLIQAMGLKADSAESAKLRKSLQASSGQVQDNSISSDHRKLLSELETLKKQDSLSAEATARLERQKEARRLLRVKQELMLELHEQKKAKAAARERANRVGLGAWDYDGIVTSKDRSYTKRRSFKKERTSSNLQDSYEDYNVFEDKGWEYDQGSERNWKKPSKKSKASNHDDWD